MSTPLDYATRQAAFAEYQQAKTHVEQARMDALLRGRGPLQEDTR